jgi:hypothetical protein
MKIALLISGHCRAFVYQEQRIFFERLIQYLSQFGQCDTYLMLKTDHLMQTEQGLINLEKMIKTINPVYSIAFKQWNQHDNNCYYSQMKMIRHLIEKASKYNHDYDFYIRIRPDSIITNLNEINFNQHLCSARKFDAKANDQIFIMSRQMVEHWFLKISIVPENTSPEYIIFNNVTVPQLICSGVIRGYKNIGSWNFHHCSLNIKDYWLDEQSFVSIPNEVFINKLKTIMDYQEVI